MTRNNNIQSMNKQNVVAGLYFWPAEFVVSICPCEYIRTGEYNM